MLNFFLAHVNFLHYAKFLHLVLSNTSVYLILTEIPAILFFFCDGLNIKFFYFFTEMYMTG